MGDFYTTSPTQASQSQCAIQNPSCQRRDALELLAMEEPLQARVVKLRFFAGLSNAEDASALGVSEKTV